MIEVHRAQYVEELLTLRYSLAGSKDVSLS
jgi:hypothetical protein